MNAPAPAATVLLVDDEPANLALLFEALRREGHRVLMAESGERALEAAGRAVPDLVLLDVRLPGIDGFTTCERLRALPAWTDVPVIFLTSLNEPGEKVRAFGCGAVDYVTKPIQSAEVVARVGAQLGLLALRRELAARNEELKAEVAARRETEALLSHSLEHAVILLEATGAVRFATRRAEHFLREAGCEGAVLRLPDAWWAVVGGCCEPRKLPLPRERREALRVTVLPEPASGGWCLWFEENVAAEPNPGRLMRLGLTVREAEVLFWISEGKNNPEIAVLLGISGRTVEKHVENLFNKLGVDHRHAASRLAQEALAAAAPWTT